MEHLGILYFKGPDGNRRRGYIIRDLLLDMINSLPPYEVGEPGYHATWRAYSASLAILASFFGYAWNKRYLHGGSATDFMRSDMEGFERMNVHYYRTIQLAEMLFNLQRVSGFDEVLGRLRGGEVESTFAELEVGMLLTRFGVSFRFVKPDPAVGTYDLELFHPNGALCCGETKTKIETNPYTEKSVINSLQGARSQLPKDGSGVIFLKVPGDWLTTPELPGDITDMITRFLGGTGRVAAVVAYGVEHSFKDDLLIPVFLGDDLVSPRRSNDTVDWRLIRRFPGPIPFSLNWLNLPMFCATAGSRQPDRGIPDPHP